MAGGGSRKNANLGHPGMQIKSLLLADCCSQPCQSGPGWHSACSKIVHNPKRKKPRYWRGSFHQVTSTWHPGSLGYDVRRAEAFGTLLDVEGDGLSFGQGFETTGLDGIVVDEDVLRTIGRGDKAEAFLVTEPLNCTCSHYGYLCLI
jgi:hypothetical protein